MSAPPLDLPGAAAYIRALGAADGMPRGSAGAVAALSVALAVDLVAQVAGCSPEWPERGGALAQADVIRERSVTLAADVECAFEAALAALQRADGSDEAGHGAVLGDVLGRLVELLLGVADAAADAAALAELATGPAAPAMAATAVSAATMAACAAEVAAQLISVNLVVGAGDERLSAARELAGRTAAVRDAARARLP